MFEMYLHHTYELKNEEKTRLCAYCGKPVTVEIVKDDKIVSEEHIEYSCTCELWNKSIDYNKEIVRYSRELVYDSLVKTYNPKVDKMSKLDFEKHCLLKAARINRPY